MRLWPKPKNPDPPPLTNCCGPQPWEATGWRLLLYKFRKWRWERYLTAYRKKHPLKDFKGPHTFPTIKGGFPELLAKELVDVQPMVGDHGKLFDCCCMRL